MIPDLTHARGINFRIGTTLIAMKPEAMHCRSQHPHQCSLLSVNVPLATNLLLCHRSRSNPMQLVDKHRSRLETRRRQAILREAILMEQLPQVKFIARKIHARLPHYVDVQDLIHAGILGLLDAVSKYDKMRNVQFKSYAQFRIRGAILDNLRELDW